MINTEIGAQTFSLLVFSKLFIIYLFVFHVLNLCPLCNFSFLIANRDLCVDEGGNHT